MSSSIAKIPLRQVKDVRSLLVNDMAKSQLQAVAARHMTPERMMRLMANSIRSTPKLAECEPMSLLGALMTCASLGLEPNTVMGHAYLIPFKNTKKKITEVNIVIGYKGLIDLARRSGHITSISANIHYEDDELWDYEEGTDARLRHRPGKLEGEKLHAYAIAKFSDGGHAYVVLPWAHVMKVRDQSQNWQSAVRYGTTDRNAWATHEDAMAKKTAIRALAKYLPLSTEFRNAFEIDGQNADYRAFAMDHTAGLEIEGEAESASDFVEDTDAEPQEKPDQAKTSAAEKSETSPDASKTVEASKKSEEPEIDAEAYDGLVNLIKGEIEEASDIGVVEAVLELYKDQIDPIEGTAYYHEIQAVADARREEIAKEL